ncbi:uncharacterized protein RCC_10832 [Ramularia collo-cygni]|uniref:WSC domain-containing protein n=1 Tax=Ramularia collo-cygni TaxID=112498 RepID=A0A2D3VAJ6_9PEZI|nr:uncharacterized protein RCC_10832 [Ramularia collo-cygni]CZT25103.1 uncharacterized protein RCC_10832 [Ramularia collo-cygni]
MRYTLFLSLLTSISPSSANQAPICEDSINSQQPFNNNAIPCLLNCGLGVTIATGDLFPGQVNSTETPYCRLNCVRQRQGVTPAQSSAAPACNSRCEERNSATPDQLGWCMYWCVQGGEIEEFVVGTSCVPSIVMVPTATVTEHGITITEDGFTMPTEWASWYQTQTVLSRQSSPLGFAPASTATDASTSISDGGYYDSYGRYHAASESATVTSCVGSMDGGYCSSVSSTESRKHLFSTTSTTQVTGTHTQSAETTSASAVSTTTARSGSSETYRAPWVMRACIAWVVNFVW